MTLNRARAVTGITPSVLRRIDYPEQCLPVRSAALRGSNVTVPTGGPVTFLPVSTTYTPSPLTDTGKWSMPRGAGPSRFSPRIVYLLPWHRHSNHLLLSHSCGIWQPRCGHLRYSAITERSAKARLSSV